jgi:hypothetical protein
MGIRVHRDSMYESDLRLVVKMQFIVSRGRVYLTDGMRDRPVSLDPEDEVPLKAAMKWAKKLGFEDELVRVLEDQAAYAREQAIRTRDQAADEYASRLRTAGESDARSARILTALSEVRAV